VWLDGKIERVRERGAVRQKCLVIAYAVHESGRREVIGLDVGASAAARAAMPPATGSPPATASPAWSRRSRSTA
jgi:hypothetical protein